MPLLMRYISSRSAEHAITELRKFTTYAEPKTYESNNENMNNANDGVCFGSTDYSNQLFPYLSLRDSLFYR